MQKISYLVKRNLNPRFIDFVRNNLNSVNVALDRLSSIVEQQRHSETSKARKSAVHKRLQSMRNSFDEIEARFVKLLSDFKSYNLEARDSFQLFGHELLNFREQVEDSVDIYEENPEIGVILSLSSDFTAFKSRVDHSFWKIENAPFYYSFLAILGVIFSFVPFINLASIIIGIVLLAQKDWRALLSGVIIIILLAIQFGNLIYIAVG